MLIHKDEMQKKPIKYLFKKEKSQTLPKLWDRIWDFYNKL